jgi:hypothetical protein
MFSAVDTIAQMSGSSTLLPGEEIFLESAKLSLRLTNFRVCHRSTVFPNPQFVSLSLEAIAAAGLRTVSWLWMLVVAGILLVLALVLAQLPFGVGNPFAGALLFLAILFVILYFVTRERSLFIESMGGYRILVPCKGLSLEECSSMVQAIHRAKLYFLRRLAREP